MILVALVTISMAFGIILSDIAENSNWSFKFTSYNNEMLKAKQNYVQQRHKELMAE